MCLLSDWPSRVAKRAGGAGEKIFAPFPYVFLLGDSVVAQFGKLSNMQQTINLQHISFLSFL
jgi:hypothetical protein